MAWDLWSWSHDQVTLERSASEWRCGFYFGCGRDVIEESLLDEKACIQVLRILISKADTEIDELEKDLVSLQTELAFAEHKELPEICCNALSDKIDCLDISIKSLKSKSENDIGVQLSMHREPAEKIQDILIKYLQEKDKQPPQVIVLDLKSDASNIMVKEEFGETHVLQERCTITNPCSKLQEKKTNYLIKIKPLNTNPTDPSPECLRLSASSSEEGKNLVTNDSDSTMRQWEAVEQGLNCTDKRIIQNASLKHEEKRSCNLDGAEVIGNMEARKQDCPATKNLQAEGIRADKKANEHSNAIIKYTSPDAFIRSAAICMTNKPSDSEFKASTSRTLLSDNCVREQKIAELITKSAQKECIKNFQLNKDVSSNLRAKIVVNRRDNLQLVTNARQFAMTLKNHIGKNSIKTELEEVEELEVEESQKAVVAYDKFHLDLGQKQQSLKAKRKFQSNSQSIRGTTFPSTEGKSNVSSTSTLKRRKPDMDDDNVCLNQLIGGKHWKKMVPRNSCAKEHKNSLAMAPHLPQPQETKRTSNVPLSSQTKDLATNLNFSDSHGHVTDGGPVDNDPNERALTPFSSPSHRLDDMKLPELKTMAKQYNIKKIGKLRKQQLIELIVERQGCPS